MGKKLVSIIIPTFEREIEVISCLKSVSKIDYSPYEIIVVDNNSSDNTVPSVRRLFPHVKLICLPENRGAVGGRNEGIKHAKGNYLLFLDSDNFVTPHFLSELVSLMETDKDIGFTGPKMCYYGDMKRIWYAGGTIDLLTSRTKYIGNNEMDNGQYDSVRDVGHIPNCWLVRREIIQKIGPMDDSYVMTYGEADWPMRAKQAGFKIMFCPMSIVYHNIPLPANDNSLRGKIGFDNSYRVFYFAKNRILFMRKHTSPLKFLAFIIFFNNLFLFQYCLILMLSKKPYLIFSYIRGYFSGLIWLFRRIV